MDRMKRHTSSRLLNTALQVERSGLSGVQLFRSKVETFAANRVSLNQLCKLSTGILWREKVGSQEHYLQKSDCASGTLALIKRAEFRKDLWCHFDLSRSVPKAVEGSTLNDMLLA
jgi:hypothetical protein